MRFLIASLLLLTTACSLLEQVSTEAPQGRQVVLKHDAWVKTSNTDAEQKKAGDIITVSDQAVLVESPGRVGVVVLPVKQNPDQVEIELRPISNWAGDATKEMANQMLSELMQEMTKVQVDLSQGNASSALSRVRDLRGKYPNVSFLKLTEASCLVVMGQNNEAKNLLEQILVESPANAEAKTLLQTISSRGSVQ